MVYRLSPQRVILDVTGTSSTTHTNFFYTDRRVPSPLPSSSCITRMSCQAGYKVFRTGKSNAAAARPRACDPDRPPPVCQRIASSPPRVSISVSRLRCPQKLLYVWTVQHTSVSALQVFPMERCGQCSFSPGYTGPWYPAGPDSDKEHRWVGTLGVPQLPSDIA